MAATVTDEQLRQLPEAAKPYSLGLLGWELERDQDGAEATERERQRRMVSLRADGVIAISSVPLLPRPWTAWPS